VQLSHVRSIFQQVRRDFICSIVPLISSARSTRRLRSVFRGVKGSVSSAFGVSNSRARLMNFSTLFESGCNRRIMKVSDSWPRNFAILDQAF
jgi:hypothetical protein